MAAQIFNAPEEVKVPRLSIQPGKDVSQQIEDHQKAEEKYIQDVKDWLHKNGFNKKNAGEIIEFPVADGKALYMVVSMKPMRLVHLEVGDAWCFQYANLLTAKEVQEKIDQRKAIDKLFSKK